MTSLELNHPMSIVKKTTPTPMIESSIQSHAKVISKKNLVNNHPPPSDKIMPVSTENKPRYAYSISVIWVICLVRAPTVRNNTFSFILTNLLLITAPARTTSPVTMLKSARKRIIRPSLSKSSLTVLRINRRSIKETFGNCNTNDCWNLLACVWSSMRVAVT